MFVLLVLITVLAVCLISLIFYGRANYGFLESCGIPVVKPSLFLGSNPNYHKEIQHHVDLERFRKYGGIWGVYDGRSPQVYVCDPELVRLILVKDYDHFSNRRDIDLGSPVMNEILDFLPGEKWKTVRSIVSPLFTTSKLKTMTDVIDGHALEYMQDLIKEAKENGGKIKYDCKKRLSTWLIDMFARTTLGVSFNDAKNPDNDYANAFRGVIGETSPPMDWLYTLSQSFPFLSKLAPSQMNHEPTKLIDQTVRRILEARRNGGATGSTKDFVDFLNSIWTKVDTPDYKRLGISENTVIAQAINFFVGGYETSSTTMSHLLHNLAVNSEIQDTLYEEISSRFSDGTPIDHDSIKDENAPYLTACLNESLRMFPPVIRIERVCTKDWTHNGIKIKKGTEVFVPIYAGQRDSEIFPDPDEYHPERFLPENKSKLNPYATTVFGHGPRNCIGMRFAYESIRVFLIHLLLNFRIEIRKDTQLNYRPGSQFFLFFDPLYLDLVRR